MVRRLNRLLPHNFPNHHTSSKIVPANHETKDRPPGFRLAKAAKGERRGDIARKFEIKQAKDGQYYFNLKARNGRITRPASATRKSATPKTAFASTQKTPRPLRGAALQGRQVLFPTEGEQRRGDRAEQDVLVGLSGSEGDGFG